MPLSMIAALICAALFTGAAGYITLVEHPARLRLEDGPLLAQWQPSYAKALPLQSGLAIVGSLLGLVAWYSSGDWRWALGSAVLLVNWPYTLSAIMPTNQRLKAIHPDQAGPESRTLLLAWGRLHAVRTVFGLASMLLFGRALTSIA